MAPVAAVTRGSAAGLLIVVALTAALVSRPAEYLVDGSDGSVYLNIGRSLATHGALVFPAPVLDLIPADRWEALLEREHVVVVPGKGFSAPGYIRISYATSMDRLREGATRMLRFVTSLQPSGASASH